MNFGEAMEVIKRNGSVQREGWNGKGMCVYGQFPDEHSEMTHSYLVIVIPNVNGTEDTRLIPWQPAQVDLFAEDWSVA